MSEIRVNNLSNESSTGGPTITGITTFSGTNYFVPPVGNTAERPENPEKGSIRFNTDRGHLEYFRGEAIGWTEVEATNDELNGGYRGLNGGGDHASDTNTIDYITISTLANAVDFGDLTDNREYLAMGPLASRTRCVFAGGQSYPSPNDEMNLIDYVTITSTGNAVDFGDLIGGNSGKNSSAMACSNEIRGIVAGGYDPPSAKDQILYITIAATGNAVDFGGDLPAIANNGCGISNTTRGIFNAGSADSNALSYITIMTTGVDASDFGDTIGTNARSNQTMGGNSTRAIIAGGSTPAPGVNTISYLTIATLGNAADFGDLTAATNGAGAVSSPTRMVCTAGKRDNSFSVTCDYVEIMTLGNAKDFGDSTEARMVMGYGSNGHGGL